MCGSHNASVDRIQFHQCHKQRPEQQQALSWRPHFGAFPVRLVRARAATRGRRRGLWPRLPPAGPTDRYRRHHQPDSRAKANAIAERVIGTLRRECLDHLIVLDEQHLSSVLREFVSYYSQERPHRTLGLQTPEPRPRPTTGPIRPGPVLNGLHHVYARLRFCRPTPPGSSAQPPYLPRRAARAACRPDPGMPRASLG